MNTSVSRTIVNENNNYFGRYTTNYDLLIWFPDIKTLLRHRR